MVRVRSRSFVGVVSNRSATERRQQVQQVELEHTGIIEKPTYRSSPQFVHRDALDIPITATATASLRSTIHSARNSATLLALSGVLEDTPAGSGGCVNLCAVFRNRRSVAP